MSETKAGLPVLAFADAAAWEAWLAAQPQGGNGAWLKIAKRGNSTSTLTKSDSIDGALAHGWIDGQIDKYDDAWFLTRFTPRRSRSKWSAINAARRAMKPTVQCVVRRRPHSLRKIYWCMIAATRHARSAISRSLARIGATM